MVEKKKDCLACRLPLTFVGVREFRTGGSGGLTTFFLGEWAEISEDLLPLAIWGCTSCGRVELFLPSKSEGPA